METFNIDFFELMFLAESVIPERPIARSMCFDDFSEIHYHKMNEKQREQFYSHVINLPGFNNNKEQCYHFECRFNPKRQWIVQTNFNGAIQTHKTYFYNNNHHTSKNQYIDEKYIISQKPLNE
jgi:hypothetical protein